MTSTFVPVRGLSYLSLMYSSCAITFSAYQVLSYHKLMHWSDENYYKKETNDEKITNKIEPPDFIKCCVQLGAVCHEVGAF